MRNRPNKIEVVPNQYPLWPQLPLAGVVAAVFGGLLFSSLLAAFSIFVLFAIAGLLWRRDEPPVLVFALGYQWIYVVAGYLYGRLKPEFAGTLGGNVELAIGLSMLGFVALACGIRLGLWLLRSQLNSHLAQRQQSVPTYSIRRLFYVTVAVYSVNWVFEILPMVLAYNAAQVIYSLLTIREVFLVMLWLVIVRQRQGYWYGISAFAFALLPRFISTQSGFKELFFLLIVVFLTELRPWMRSFGHWRRNPFLAPTIFILTVLLMFGGILWEGAIKPAWRGADVDGSPTDKLNSFYNISRNAVTQLDLPEGFEALIARVSSISQFGLVLERVPAIVPHERGKLLLRAIKHVLMPRFLFPNKPDLGLDSWLAIRYAGMEVGEGTSVGIGYMAEFYVDFGFYGMFGCLLLFGVFLSIVYVVLVRSSSFFYLSNAVVMIPFMGGFLTFEGHFAKILGGAIVNTAVLILVMRFLAPWLDRKLAATKTQAVRRFKARRYARETLGETRFNEPS